MKEPIRASDFAYSDPVPLKLVRHRTINSLLSAAFSDGDEKVSVAELRAGKFGGMTVDEHGELGEIETSYEEYVASIRREGFWGFASKERGEVHVWISRRAKLVDVVFFLAHEIGHTRGDQNPDDLEEEKRADSYGSATVTAMQWLGDLGLVRDFP